jgi:folylpolyglutamate synthase/dihydropteroate synthase
MQGVEALLAYLEAALRNELQEVREVTIVLGVLQRKEWRQMLRRLSERGTQLARELQLVFRFVFSTSEHPLSVAPQELVNFLGGGMIQREPGHYIKELYLSSESQSLIVIAGSIYLMGQLRPHLVDHFETLHLEATANPEVSQTKSI